MIKGRDPRIRATWLVAAQLFLFIGRGVALEEQEFRAQQPAAFGALGRGQRCIRLGAREIGEHFDALAAGEMAIHLRGGSLLLTHARPRSRRFSVSASVRASGSALNVPASASRMTLLPDETSSSDWPMATSMGMPRVAARIATCDVGPPAASAMPASFDASISTSCEGVRSRASRMPSCGITEARSLRAIEREQDLPVQVAQIVDSFGQPGVAGGGQVSRAGAQALAPAEPSALAAGDGIARGVDEIRVVEQLEVCGHDFAHGRGAPWSRAVTSARARRRGHVRNRRFPVARRGLLR